MSVDSPANGIPPTPTSAAPPSPDEEGLEPGVLAERTKEQGNVAFKAKRYGEAINLYTKAISASSRCKSGVTSIDHVP